MEYLIQKSVTIRKEPRIVEVKAGRVYLTNAVGTLAKGDVVEVRNVIADSNGVTWGQISQEDPNRKSDWFCISTRNTIFAVLLEETPVPPASLMAYMSSLDAWAREQGFDGPALAL